MDVVSYETAKRLKAAGFPQPETVFAGFFYFVDKPDPIAFICCTIAPQSNMYYAPSAADILRQMPGAHLMWFGVEFRCKYRGESYDRNPSEACAAEWLRIFEPKVEANSDAKYV